MNEILFVCLKGIRDDPYPPDESIIRWPVIQQQGMNNHLIVNSDVTGLSKLLQSNPHHVFKSVR